MNSLLIKTRVSILIIVMAVITYGGVCYSTNSQLFQISHFSFGKIIINDKSYTSDISIWPNGKIESGPEDMHFMSTIDFKELFNSDIKKLVIGTGYEGKVEMDISRKIEKKIKDNNVELILMRTEDLVKFLNETPKRDFLVFAHLTC
jgi:hypothetical protein